MIIVYHNNSCVIEAKTSDDTIIDTDPTKPLVYELMRLAIRFSNSKLVWCHLDLQGVINLGAIPEILHHKKIMVSYNPEMSNYFGSTIGYIEESPFINVNKKVSYPTWQMSSLVGGIHASVLLALKNQVTEDENFDYFLHSIAKLSMPNGLLCYSEPKLLKESLSDFKKYPKDLFVLFRFVKQHYKTRWLFLLFLNLFLYERKLPVMPFVFSLFYKKRKLNATSLSEITVESSKKVVDSGTIDVIIPTIGRKLYLYDVLKDLSKQTHLPQTVIIVEQNPQEGSVSELDYLTTEHWPFKIKHTFTHQAGACNARNIALSQVESEWVFMADDDIKIEVFFIERALDIMDKTSIYAGVFRCYLAEQKNNKNYNGISQTTFFGSGCSIVKKVNLHHLMFNKKLEFGYGEDTDFGLQLRNIGIDIIYFPEPSILHLKAPIGGFRIKPVFPWSAETIQPKPSPTVMYVKRQYDSKEQLLGYKLTFSLKSAKSLSYINCIDHFVFFSKRWKSSVNWAKKLKSND